MLAALAERQQKVTLELREVARAGALGQRRTDRLHRHSRRNGTVVTSTLVRRRSAVPRITPR
jgi:hypothetical protein